MSKWIANPFEILCLRDFDEKLSGGSELAVWLRYQRDALEARPATSPVLVLVDWEMPRADRATYKKLQEAVSAHPTSACFAWPEDLANPDLGPSWVGIERYFSTPFIEYMRAEYDLRLMTPSPPGSETWRYAVSKQQLNAHKPWMHDELAERDNPADIEPVIEALPWLAQHVKDAPPLL